ncbi:MAG: EAL domain-containing protein, partial [Raoultibacter sp.]
MEELYRKTGCLDYAHFVDEARRKLATAQSNEYALIAVDCDDFKYLNDLFGYEQGDRALQSAADRFGRLLKAGEFFAHVHADHFIFFVPAAPSEVLIERFTKILDMELSLSSFLPTHYNLIASGGIYYISNPAKKLEAMIDKANFARKQAKGNHVTTIVPYTQNMRDELWWKKEITLSMAAALEKEEFKMYLQPKVLMKTGEVVGAEALVRWVRGTGEVVYPDRFIPVFEQNRFVVPLDFYMLEQACLFLKKCMGEHIPVVPISVNFSKAHLTDSDFVETIFETVNKLGISTNLIEIELTESIFSYDLQSLIDTASALRYLGFSVSLDDFGSEYSSLGRLKDFPADIIKIDKSFLEDSVNSEKGRLIVAKVLDLIKSLRLRTVVEGVETLDQVDFLKKMSCCDIAQGYFYAKPMPSFAYEEFVKKNEVAEGNMQAPVTAETEAEIENQGKAYLEEIPSEFQMDNWELYTLGQNIDMGLMKGYLDGDATVQYVNKRALEYFGCTAREFREIYHNTITSFTHPDDVATVKNNEKRLIETGKPVSFQTRAIRADGKIIYLQGRSSCVTDNRGRLVGLHAFQDVTESREETLALQNSLQSKVDELQSLYTNVRCGVIYRTMDERCDLLSCNDGFTKLTGYTKEEVWRLFGGSLVGTVVPQGRAVAAENARRQLETGNYQSEYQITTKEGEVAWIFEQGQVVAGKEGSDPCLCGILVDITADKESSEALRVSEERYRIVAEQSDDIIFEWDFETDCTTFSEKYKEVLGFKAICDHMSCNEKVFDRIHPDDIEIYKSWIADTYKKTNPASFEFRLRTSEDRYIWMRTRSTAVLDREGNPLRAVGVFININEQKAIIDELRMKSEQDSLTKLYDREGIRKHTDDYLAAHADERGTFLIADIDDFRDINEHLGHQFGDAVLVGVAREIQEVLDNQDLAGRLGGDEFVVFMPRIADIDDIRAKTKAVMQAAQRTYFGDKITYQITGSLGLARYPEHAQSFDALYKAAGIALFESKSKGKNRCTFYSDDMQSGAANRRSPVEVSRRFVSRYFEHDLIYNIFEMLYETKDLPTTLNAILELLGKQFDLDRVYLFERLGESMEFRDVYE